MARNSVTGHFRNIEISFRLDGKRTFMGIRNLINDERQLRVMYQKQPTSGLANWKQLQLRDTPVSFRIPTEVLDAYRLTFFVDNADPISARVEKVLAELKTVSSESPEENLPAHSEPGAAAQSVETPSQADVDIPEAPEGLTAKQIESTSDIPKIQEATQIPQAHPKSQVPPEERLTSSDAVTQPSEIRKFRSEMPNLSFPAEFKISIPSFPPSALVEQRKAQMEAMKGTTTPKVDRKSKRKEKGFFGQLVHTLSGGKRGRAYYEERGETVQNEFQDQLSKLERDYNEGYGLNLIDWKLETLCEEEIAMLLLNLMVNEVSAWQKEAKRATPETEGIIETLTKADTLLRQTLTQTRGTSTPSLTLFPSLLAENERDLEKIQKECDAYLHRFAGKLMEQEKKHATKIEVRPFRKFLAEFIRDFLFVEITKGTQGQALPERLNWFLELVDTEVMPIEIGKTKVSSNHHKVEDTRPSEYEPGTIAEVVTPGLQSKDGKFVKQMAVVIKAE